MDIFKIDEELDHFGDKKWYNLTGIVWYLMSNERWYNLKKPFPEIDKMYPKFYKSIWRMILCWAIFLVPFCLAYSYILPNNQSIDIFFGITFLISAYYSLFVIIKTFLQKTWYKVEKKLFYEKVDEWKKDPDSVNFEFYEACKKIGVNDLSSSKNFARIVEFARKNGSECTKGEIKQSFLYCEKKEEQEKERTYKNELEKYAELVGREKTRAMLKDLIKETNDKIESLNNDIKKAANGATILHDSVKPRQTDWAIMGGIADAIAGPAAGVAVALDVQKRNEEANEGVRAYQNSVTELYWAATTAVSNRITKCEHELQCYEKELKRLATRKIKEFPEQYLLDSLTLSVAGKEVTKTGALKFIVRCDQISIDKNMIIDGAIRVNLMSADGKKLGDAIAVLPYTGTKERCKIDVISCNVNSVKKVTRFEFEPYHLWAIEG